VQPSEHPPQPPLAAPNLASLADLPASLGRPADLNLGEVAAPWRRPEADLNLGEVSKLDLGSKLDLNLGKLDLNLGKLDLNLGEVATA